MQLGLNIVSVEPSDGNKGAVAKLKIMTMDGWSQLFEIPVAMDCVIELPGDDDKRHERHIELLCAIAGNHGELKQLVQTRTLALSVEIAALTPKPDIAVVPRASSTAVSRSKRLLAEVRRFDPSMLVPLDQLKLPKRVRKALEMEKVFCIGDLVLQSEVDILRTPTLGRKSLADIKAALKAKGLRLGMSFEAAHEEPH